MGNKTLTIYELLEKLSIAKDESILFDEKGRKLEVAIIDGSFVFLPNKKTLFNLWDLRVHYSWLVDDLKKMYIGSLEKKKLMDVTGIGRKITLIFR